MEVEQFTFLSSREARQPRSECTKHIIKKKKGGKKEVQDGLKQQHFNSLE